jgi:dihydrofolate reductase
MAYVTDGIVIAMAKTKAAAGDRNVMVHGAYTAQQALQAGVLDDLMVHQIPVLFGGGRAARNMHTPRLGEKWRGLR